MQLRILEVFSGQPVAAKLTINLEFLAVVLQMFGNAFVGLDLLVAAEALDFKALAFVLNVLFKVFKIHALVQLGLVALVHHLELAEHLSEKFVFNLLVNRLNDLDRLTWSRGRVARPLAVPTARVVGTGGYFDDFLSLAVVALVVLGARSILVRQL